MQNGDAVGYPTSEVHLAVLNQRYWYSAEYHDRCKFHWQWYAWPIVEQRPVLIRWDCNKLQSMPPESEGEHLQIVIE